MDDYGLALDHYLSAIYLVSTEDSTYALASAGSQKSCKTVNFSLMDLKVKRKCST